MNSTRRILLIEPLEDASAAARLADALRRAGAEVRQLALPGQADAVLDAIEQGWMPVALKSPAGAAPAHGMAGNATSTAGTGLGDALTSHGPEHKQ